MLNKVFYSIVFAVLVFFIAGLFLPGQVHVERQIDIQRPAATVFTVVNSYRNFPLWSPWADRDPGARYEFSGPAAGVGAKMSWRGDPRLVGTGWQEITESRPYSWVRMQLDFEQQGQASSYLQIDGSNGMTHVTWGFDTDLLEGQSWFAGLLARYFGLFFDKWIGTDYEAGLARLKALVESMPPADFADLEVEIVQVEPADILYVRSTAAEEHVNLDSSLAVAYREITSFMAANGIEMAAQPMAIMRIHEPQGFEVDAAIPVTRGDVEPGARVLVGKSPAGRALRVIHRGPYDRMAPKYEQVEAWMAAHGLPDGQVSWEQYISDPRETPAEALITHIYFLLEDEQ
jgi:effector-binding domain-containing protein